MKQGLLRNGGWALIAALLMVLGMASAFAGRHTGDLRRAGPASCSGTYGNGGSGQVPTPLLTGAQKVELADGEVYVLVGWVRTIQGATYFEVDLEQMPWLANARRKADPMYPILPSTFPTLEWEGEHVKIVAEARGMIVSFDNQLGYVIGLVPQAEIVTSIAHR